MLQIHLIEEYTTSRKWYMYIKIRYRHDITSFELDEFVGKRIVQKYNMKKNKVNPQLNQYVIR